MRPSLCNALHGSLDTSVPLDTDAHPKPNPTCRVLSAGKLWNATLRSLQPRSTPPPSLHVNGRGAATKSSPRSLARIRPLRTYARSATPTLPHLAVQIAPSCPVWPFHESRVVRVAHRYGGPSRRPPLPQPDATLRPSVFCCYSIVLAFLSRCLPLFPAWHAHCTS